jgi:hypothetical protein
MRPRDLARLRQSRSAAYQSCHRYTVMGRAKWARPINRTRGGEVAQKAPDLRHFQGLLQLKRRQDPGQTARKHRLAGAWWPAQKKVVATRGGHLDGATSLLLSMNLSKVVLGSVIPRLKHRPGCRLRLYSLGVDEVRDDTSQGAAGNYLEAIHQRRLRRVGRRNEEAFITLPPQPAGCDQHSIDVTHRAVKRELTKECRAWWCRLTHHRKRDRNSDWKVEAAALLT